MWPLGANPDATRLKDLKFAGGQMQQVIVPTFFKKTRKSIVLAALAMVVIGPAAIVFLALHWPFTREAVLKQLEDVSLGRVDAGAFHGTYFPRPGCVLEHVIFQHNPKAGSPPLITVERLRIEGSFAGLFTEHVRLIRAEGLRILTPPQGSDEQFSTAQEITFRDRRPNRRRRDSRSRIP